MFKSHKSVFRGHITQNAIPKRKNGMRGVQETPETRPERESKTQLKTQIDFLSSETQNAERRTQNAQNAVLGTLRFKTCGVFVRLQPNLSEVLGTAQAENPDRLFAFWNAERRIQNAETQIWKH